MSTSFGTTPANPLKPPVGSTRGLTLHHIAGLSAGGSMELTPGEWDFGPAARGVDRLRDGDPAEIDFSLTVDDQFTVWLEPRSARVRLDDEPVIDRVSVGNRTISAGASRFAIGPSGPVGRWSTPIGRDPLHPWVTDPIPEPIYGSRGGLSADELIELRRRLHPGIVEIRRFALDGGGAVWFRRPQDRQFGLVAVGIADMAIDLTRRGGGRVRGPLAAVPLSVDLLAQPTVVIGSRRQQLALVAQMVLNGAATTDPDHLRFGLDSDRPDLSFIGDLPHWAGRPTASSTARPRSVLVVDRTGSTAERARRRWPRPTDEGSLLVLGRRGDPIPTTANVITLGSSGSMAIHTPVPGSDSIRMAAGVTPMGVSPSMARELADRLARIHRS